MNQQWRQRNRRRRRPTIARRRPVPVVCQRCIFIMKFARAECRE
jgi:hypothetical protein